MPNIFLVIRSLALVVLFFTSCQSGPASAEKEVSLHGKIVNYTSNRIGDLDRLIIDAGDKQTPVHFLPHTAQRVVELLPVGTDAHLEVHQSTGIRQEYELISILVNHQSLQLASLTRPVSTENQGIEISGHDISFKKDDGGKIVALILGEYLLDLPPNIVGNILPLIRDSVILKVKGYERNPSSGFVNKTGYRIIKPYELSVGKTDYLL